MKKKDKKKITHLQIILYYARYNMPLLKTTEEQLYKNSRCRSLVT